MDGSLPAEEKTTTTTLPRSAQPRRAVAIPNAGLVAAIPGLVSGDPPQDALERDVEMAPVAVVSGYHEVRAVLCDEVEDFALGSRALPLPWIEHGDRDAALEADHL